jgi:hypothetical protein
MSTSWAPALSGEAWLQRAAGTLQAGGFVPLDPQQYYSLGFKYAVRRTRFEITKFGMAETFFVFADIAGPLSPQIMAGFSDVALQLAMRSKKVGLPCGVFESVWCFSVAITNGLHPQVADVIRNTTPPKHFSAGEIPVVYDAATGQLAYFEQTPMWGAAYYAGFRREIERFLR